MSTATLSPTSSDLRITYVITIIDIHDPYIALIERAMAVCRRTSTLGVPRRRHTALWVPLCPFVHRRLTLIARGGEAHPGAVPRHGVQAQRAHLAEVPHRRMR